MTARLELRVDDVPFERAKAELAVAGFFLDERPLRGAAGRADWRLCGAASALLTSKRLRGRVGEAVLIPSFGRVAAQRVLLLGLGRRSSFRPSRAHEASASALRRATQLGASDIAIAPLVATPQDVIAQLGGLLRAASRVVRESSIRLALRIVIPPGQAAGALDALQLALDEGPSEEAQLIELVLPGSRTSPEGPMVPMGRSVV